MINGQDPETLCRKNVLLVISYKCLHNWRQLGFFIYEILLYIYMILYMILYIYIYIFNILFNIKIIYIYIYIYWILYILDYIYFHFQHLDYIYIYIIYIIYIVYIQIWLSSLMTWPVLKEPIKQPLLLRLVDNQVLSKLSVNMFSNILFQYLDLFRSLKCRLFPPVIIFDRKSWKVSLEALNLTYGVRRVFLLLFFSLFHFVSLLSIV